MIAILSNAARERAAFSSLCESRGWPTVECESLPAFARAIRNTRVKIALVRHKLGQVYSDDAIALLARNDLLTATKVIVLMAAGTPASAEARQLALGADCVQRDPVRTEVLLEYLTKYQASSRPTKNAKKKRVQRKPLPFAGASFVPLERVLEHKGQRVSLTPREAELLELLAQSEGEILSYDTLYCEVLHRRFVGDTSNMRVLLGKLTTSANHVGIALRHWIEVIPKTGYWYRNPQLGQKSTNRHRSVSVSAL
jgi:DNA-binding response OmpR family regulator